MHLHTLPHPCCLCALLSCSLTFPEVNPLFISDCTYTDVHTQVRSKHTVRYITCSMFLRGMGNANTDVGPLMVKVRRGLAVSEGSWKPTLSSNHLLSLQQGCTQQQQQVKQSHKAQNVSRPHIDSSQEIPLKITRCAARIR